MRDLASRESEWLAEAVMPLALAHVDPRHPEAVGAVEGLAAGTGGFLVGGLTAAAGDAPHRAGDATGCLSGVALSPAAIEVATALSQGCTPLGEARTVTRGQGNVLIELDGRPALDAFVEDIGEELASDLRRVGGLVFAAIPVEGSDTADYTVRNLVGIDPTSKVVAIAESVHEGGKVLFCRRDRESAVEDMRRMTADLKRRIGNRPIRGGTLRLLRRARPEPVRGHRERDGDHPRGARRLPHGGVLRQRRAEPGPDLRLHGGADAVSLSVPQSGNLPSLSCREIRRRAREYTVVFRRRRMDSRLRGNDGYGLRGNAVPSSHSREGGNPRGPRWQGNVHTRWGVRCALEIRRWRQGGSAFRTTRGFVGPT